MARSRLQIEIASLPEREKIKGPPGAGRTSHTIDDRMNCLLLETEKVATRRKLLVHVVLGYPLLYFFLLQGLHSQSTQVSQCSCNEEQRG